MWRFISAQPRDFQIVARPVDAAILGGGVTLNGRSVKTAVILEGRIVVWREQKLALKNNGGKISI